MIHANVAEVKARLSHYLRLVKLGETVIVCDRNRPIAQLAPLPPTIDRALRESAFGMYAPTMTTEEWVEALRPMAGAEADAFVEGRY